MNKLAIIIAIFVLLPLLLGAAGMVTVIAAKFSQATIDQPQTPTSSEAVTTPAPIIDPACGDGICSKNERSDASCPTDC